MTASTLHLAIEFTESSVRYLEMHRRADGVHVTRAGTAWCAYDFSTPLLHDVPFERPLARSLLQDLTTLLSRDGMGARSVSVVLPARLAVVAAVPVDPASPPEEQRAQLSAECALLAGFDAGTEMAVLSHPLPETDAGPRVLAVALPRTTVRFLTGTFAHLTLQLRSIEMDHFVAEGWVRRSFHGSGTAAVAGLQKDRCALGVFEGDLYHGYRVRALIPHRTLARDLWVRGISEALYDLTVEHVPRPRTLHVYGTGADEETMGALAAELDAVVRPLTPFERMEVSPQARIALDDAGAGEFDIVACAARRGLV